MIGFDSETESELTAGIVRQVRSGKRLHLRDGNTMSRKSVALK